MSTTRYVRKNYIPAAWTPYFSESMENYTPSSASFIKECAMASAHSFSTLNLAQLSFEGLGTHKVDINRLCASRGFPLELAHVEGVVETFRRH